MDQPLSKERYVNNVPSPEPAQSSLAESVSEFPDEFSIKGKFFFRGKQKFYARGVTYGAFEPDESGREYTDLEKISHDFSLMAKQGINAVRIPHTTPPRKLLDIAYQHNLVVMIGLSAEQYVGYLIDSKKAPDIRKIIKRKVSECAGHPALFCIALGNEITASMVRWIGRKKIEQYLRNVYEWVKEEVPGTPVTYVNYPTTEYLDLSFLDVLCFNVYLEEKHKLESYLARLQNIADNRPLILGEVGLDSIRNGIEKQADVLDWQIGSAFKMGCSGLFVFSWTDEWFRGGEEVYDWSFGLTTKDREPKPALFAVTKAFKAVPFENTTLWPMISVIVCSYNGSRTLNECLDAVKALNYPNYEVILVNDGSTDNTEAIAIAHGVRTISTENKGLSAARNVGYLHANGEIVSYIDDDAMPDPDWLKYVAMSFMTTDAKAVGGPNLLPDSGNFFSKCVDTSPGSPTHVLISDLEAEHIPGCNMSFRKVYLAEIDGFDERFRVAGDDVDLCWRFEEKGWKIGFNAGAMVMHHRRNSLKGYWKQQMGYGKAEALLEKKWPEKYNDLGHRTWGGRLYSKDVLGKQMFEGTKVYHGTWGSAPFQSIYGSSAGGLFAFTLMPEWYILTATFIAISLLGLLWNSLLPFAGLSFLAAIIPIIHIVYSVSKQPSKNNPEFIKNPWLRFRWKATTIWLHFVQPMARLIGRLKYELTPWRRRASSPKRFPMPRKFSIWCETWLEPERRLEIIEYNLKSNGVQVTRGGDFDRWDFRVSAGALGNAKLIMAAEDHAERKQLLRFRIKPQFSPLMIYMVFFFITILLALAYDNAWIPFAMFSGFFAMIIIRALIDLSCTTGVVHRAIHQQQEITE